MKYPYLIWLIIFVFLPSVAVWAIYWKYLIQYTKTLILITLLALCWGILLDVVGSTWWGIWKYHNHLGFEFFGLPLEEYLILIFLPQQAASWFLLIRKHENG